MQELSTFRHLLVQVDCPDKGRIVNAERSTTLPDEEIREQALEVGVMRCYARGQKHWGTHTATITIIPETSTGSRRD